MSSSSSAISHLSNQTWLSHPLARLTLALVATLLWGSAFPLVKLGYSSFAIAHNQPFMQLLFAGYRFSGAGLLLLVLSSIIYRKTWQFSFSKSLSIVKVGSTQTLAQYIFFYMGLALASGISSAIVASAAPFFQLIIAHLLFADDRLSRRKLLSALLGFCGIGFYHLMEHGWAFHLGIGEGLMLIAMLFSAYGNILNKRNVSQELPVLPLTAWQMLFGGVILIVIGACKVGLTPFHFSVHASILLIYLCVLSASAFLIWNTLMAHNQVSKVSIFLFLIPIFGVTLSAVILNEALHWYVAPALTLIIIGIILSNRPERT
ncbi:DMT family transporter [Celerinatantimonas sp. MCCC 1A17872]|uniref:DMT family transporter n=1 Tax=Celerinatantimonas sp. MCCC 1A17872 TaxID=3177514 RepID=UPI0038C18C1B